MRLLTILFIIVAIVVFYYIYKWLTSKGTVTTLASAKTEQTIDATKLANTSGSNNYTYSIWMYVNDWNYRYGQPKVVFGRSDSSELGEANPSPSVVLGAMQNDLTISMTTYPSQNSSSASVHNCVVKNIPLQKWVNVLISLYGRSLDVYLDGKLVRTCVLPGVAKVNNVAPVKITPQGGFAGKTAKFMYYDGPTNPQEAWNIYKQGFASGGGFGNIFDEYKIKVSFLENNVQQGSLEI
jgi:hypothetical protein